MLGHLKPACGTSLDAKNQYRNYYCSICASLRKENGLFYSVLINHELTLVLSALHPYMMAREDAKTPCPSALFTKKNPISKHQAVDRAAHISLILGWIKAVDWQTDKPSFAKKVLCEMIEKKALNQIDKFPTDLVDIIFDYGQITKKSNTEFEKVKNASAILSKACFEYISEATILTDKTLLSALFYQIGALIPTADHILDLEQDIKSAQFNPIVSLAEAEKIPLEAAKQKMLQNCHVVIQKIRRIALQLEKEKIIDQYFAESLRSSVQGLLQKINKGEIQCVSCESRYPKKMSLFQADCYACCDCATCCSSSCSAACCACSCEALTAGCCNNCGDDGGCCSNCCDGCCDGCCNDGGTTSGKTTGNIPKNPDFPTEPIARDTIENVKSVMKSAESAASDTLNIVKDSIKIPEDLPKDLDMPQGESQSPQSWHEEDIVEQ